MLPQDRSELPARYPRTRYPRPWKLLAGVSIQPVCQTASLCNAHGSLALKPASFVLSFNQSKPEPEPKPEPQPETETEAEPEPEPESG